MNARELGRELDARERTVRLEYGSVRGAVWDALNEWADALSTKELRRLKRLTIPGDAGCAVDGALGRRGDRA